MFETNLMYEFLLVFILSYIFVYNLTPLIIKLAYKINFVDNPNARKVHKKATPLLGGLSVFIGFFVLVLFETLINPSTRTTLGTYGYLFGALMIMIVGLIDDKFGMSPIIKMILQFIVCLIFIHTNGLYYLFGNFWISIPIIILWMTGLMNAFNFLDNMDGILAGMSGILALSFYAVSFLTKTPAMAPLNNYVALLALSFAGSVLGFLPHNFNPAKLFLGDAGSMFIGYFLSTMGILTGKLAVNTMQNSMYYLLPILILSYAIFDISLVSITRKRDGRRVSQGGKDHSTHRIGTAMKSTKLTAIIVYLLNSIIALTTIIVLKMHSPILLLISTLIFVLGFLFFGRKLDKIPIIIPENQLKKKASNEI
ncbi:MAG: MraY family glycosyltransferase [Candidatus Cloacimonetes bacterium]|nr:undecaprenyl/decaprenyl-phosphate alpha-N-acetylglucosaminyl 1-phosphate transferase [Candidatus Cloacimonadota bacterium]MDD4156173.1 MraY family glycosyltransferase [Candidatus Cloacimonadota bacterium]